MTTSAAPTTRAMTTIVRSVPSIGASATTRPTAAITGSTSLIPMLNSPPAPTASVASALSRPHDVSIR